MDRDTLFDYVQVRLPVEAMERLEELGDKLSVTPADIFTKLVESLELDGSPSIRTVRNGESTQRVVTIPVRARVRIVS